MMTMIAHDNEGAGPEVEWSPAEEAYVSDLARTCRELAQKYHNCHRLYLAKQRRLQVPIIAISGAGSLLSFGNQAFPEHVKKWIGVDVGVGGMVVALLGSIESFLKVPEVIAGSLNASRTLEKTADTIATELSLTQIKRSTHGVTFARAMYADYERCIESAPRVLRKIRFVRPSSHLATDVSLMHARDSSITEDGICNDFAKII
jgi:hypothetical protein